MLIATILFCFLMQPRPFKTLVSCCIYFRVGVFSDCDLSLSSLFLPRIKVMRLRPAVCIVFMLPPNSLIICFSSTVTSSTQLLSGMNAVCHTSVKQNTRSCFLVLFYFVFFGHDFEPEHQLCPFCPKVTAVFLKWKREWWKFNQSQPREPTATQYTLFCVPMCV